MVAPRFASLLPRAGLTRGASRVTEEARAMLEERFGLAGGAPSTLEEIAARRAVKPMHVARKLRRAIREALAAGRED
jgi:DNA-directed RNA polymerase sigma subunit (sigma70/sigma32)